MTIDPASLSVLEWAQERLGNTERYVSLSSGDDRKGWLEDAAYWRAIVDVLRSSLTASERYDCLRSVEMRLGGTEGEEYQRLQALVQKLGRETT